MCLSKLNVLVLSILLIVFIEACSAERIDRKEQTMILAKILTLNTESDVSYSIKLQSISSLDDKVYTLKIPRERNDWAESSHLKQKPVGLDLKNSDIYPAQIALYVQRLYDGYKTDQGIPYFVPPRPSPIHLCESNPNFDKWFTMMTELEKTKKSVAIATGDDDCIEDIVIISRQDARGYLGMVRK